MARRILPPGVNRLTVDLSNFGLSEMPLVGVSNFTAAHEHLGEHIHPGAMEICYLTRGEQTYRVDEVNYLLRGNEVFLTFPDELHSSGLLPQGKGVLYWLQIIVTDRRSILGLSVTQSRLLKQQLKVFPRRHFRGVRKLQSLFEEFFLLACDNDSTMKKLSIASRIVGWLLILIECAHTDTSRHDGEDIRNVVDLLESYPHRDATSVELAELSGLSVSRFQAKFKEQVGIPPREYALRCKVKIAREMLQKKETSITQIAHQLGFSSSQYFATVFKRFTNMTPGQARSAFAESPELRVCRPRCSANI